MAEGNIKHHKVKKEEKKEVTERRRSKNWTNKLN